jgi:hypothetical protein
MTRRHVRERFLELRLKRSKDLGNPPLEFVKLVHDDRLIFKRRLPRNSRAPGAVHTSRHPRGMAMKRVATTAATIMTALGLAACGGSDPEATPPPTQAEPPASTPSAAAPTPGGGLSIQEAINSTLAGPLMVKGFVVAHGQGAVQLCSALAESYPPQCGGPALEVIGLDLATVEGLSRDETSPDRAWTETEISLLGNVEDGSITVSETSI